MRQKPKKTAGSRRWVRLALAPMIALSAVVVVVEIGLRVKPDILGPNLGNYVFSRYGTFPGAVCYYDELANMVFMKRSFSAQLYYNGYRWQHETDADGFRNPPGLEDKRVLLLGDSMTYGHGVEETQTVAHYLRAEHGIDAYNMARQADCLYQEYILFRLFFESYQPEVVVLLPFVNDVDDLKGWLNPYDTAADMKSLPEIDSYDYDEILRSLRSRNDGEHSLARRLRYASYSYRFFRGIVRETGRVFASPDPSGSTAPFLIPMLDEVVFEKTRRYYELILRDMAARCSAAGARLIVVYLFLEQAESGQVEEGWSRFGSLLTQACQSEGIDFHDAREVLEGRPECFLEGDGHFSPTGHRVLAQYVQTIITP